MPRSPRAEYEPGLYHVFARGNRKQPIYEMDDDRRRYVATLGRVTLRMRWRCLAYCLMGNHMHLLVETREANLGDGMHRLQGSYAQYFNRRHGHVGHLFQDRYKAVPVTSDGHLVMAAAYIARNPVDAGLCTSAIDWPWSSHAQLIRGLHPPWLDGERLLEYFGAHGGNGLARYTSLVDELIQRLPKGDSPLYGPEDSERSSGRTNQKAARRRATAAGAA
jgi:REP element-mobilizing transposase RayT